MLKMTKPDPVNKPAHYKRFKYEPFDVIMDWDLGYCLGNCVKYIVRSPHKGNRLQDLQKAEWYLKKAIASSQLSK
jgi:hypothetical protein